MRKLWFAAALFLVASTATAQEQTCDVQIRTANAMMKELMQQVHIMGDRAARHYGSLQVISAELATARAKIARLLAEGADEED